MFENQKKRKYGNKRYLYINPHLKYRLDIELTACYSELMPERALTSLTVSDAVTHIASLRVRHSY